MPAPDVSARQRTTGGCGGLGRRRPVGSLRGVLSVTLLEGFWEPQPCCCPSGYGSSSGPSPSINAATPISHQHRQLGRHSSSGPRRHLWHRRRVDYRPDPGRRRFSGHHCGPSRARLHVRHLHCRGAELRTAGVNSRRVCRPRLASGQWESPTASAASSVATSAPTYSHSCRNRATAPARLPRRRRRSYVPETSGPTLIDADDTTRGRRL